MVFAVRAPFLYFPFCRTFYNNFSLYTINISGTTLYLFTYFVAFHISPTAYLPLHSTPLPRRPSIEDPISPFPFHCPKKRKKKEYARPVEGASVFRIYFERHVLSPFFPNFLYFTLFLLSCMLTLRELPFYPC